MGFFQAPIGATLRHFPEQDFVRNPVRGDPEIVIHR